MNREKIIELAGMAGFNWPEISTTTIEERLERFATLVEREVRGAAEPVASVHIKDGCLVGSHRKSGADFPDGQYGLYPIGTHPAPAVVRQLVEAVAAAKLDIHSARLCEVNSMSSRGEVRRLMGSACEKLGAALAAAKENGL